jgi:hypothetical protein
VGQTFWLHFTARRCRARAAKCDALCRSLVRIRDWFLLRTQGSLSIDVGPSRLPTLC